MEGLKDGRKADHRMCPDRSGGSSDVWAGWNQWSVIKRCSL